MRRTAVVVAAVALLSLIPATSSQAGVPRASLSPIPPWVLTDVAAFGDATASGSTATVNGNAPIVGVAGTATSKGYWEASADGGVFSFGDAHFFGSMGGIPLNAPIVGIAPTPTGNGYWLVATDGGIFAFGDARFFGSMGGIPLNQPVVGIAATPSGHGYWLVATDGGIFAFGDARFFGSMGGIPLNKPMVGIGATANGKGYWTVATDGGIFSFGNARFFGSNGGKTLARPVVGFAARPQGDGYWMVDSDGAVSRFGGAAALGTTASITKPVIGIAPTRTGKGYWLAGSGVVTIDFVRGEKLGATTRDLRGGDVLADITNQLLAGPDAGELAAGLGTQIPAGTTMHGLTVVSSTVANVDLSSAFVSGGGSLSMMLRIAQVVDTLTELPGVTSVAFAIDGHEVATIGGEGVIVSPPRTRADVAAALPQVYVTWPGPGDVVHSPLVVAGSIDSFEGVAIFELVGANGALLARGTGQGAMGFHLPFATSFAFSPGPNGGATLDAIPSAGTETPNPPDARIPVRLR